MKPGMTLIRRLSLLYILAVMFFSIDLLLFAQTRRVLLVGINHYELPLNTTLPPCREKGLPNLEGCLNDVQAMKEILITNFGFVEKNIITLTDQKACRDGILCTFQKHLIDGVQKDDICLFYFSGHGSWMKNSALEEGSNKRDESIVPYDWYKGVPDIRDKELKRLFNHALDKGGRLTVIVDACYSGSISRGARKRGNRQAPPNKCDANKNEAKGLQDPSERGAVILSAAQEWEEALEIKDKTQNSKRGLFSWALTKALKDSTCFEPVGNLILRIDALMQSEGREQLKYIKRPSPGLEVPIELRKRPLFAIKPYDDTGLAFAITRANNGVIILQGGWAAGIHKKCQLQKITTTNKEPRTIIEITAMKGFNRSQAKIIQGKMDFIHPGDLFNVIKWVGSRETCMRIWLPEYPFPAETLIEFSNKIQTGLQNKNIQWIDDPAAQTPSHLMFWKSSSWILQNRDNVQINLGKSPSTNRIIDKISASMPQEKTEAGLLIVLPLTTQLRQTLRTNLRRYENSFRFCKTKEKSIYIPAGRVIDGELEYTWMRPEIVPAQSPSLKMPLRMEWEKINEEHSKFANLLLQLVKVRAWIQLATPPRKLQTSIFPYSLVLKKTKSGEYTTTGPVSYKDEYGLVLQATPDIQSNKKEKRYVYVFMIDSMANSTLFYPNKNFFNHQKLYPETDEWPEEIQIGKKDLFYIDKPLGMDTYILLTTKEKISDPEILELNGNRKERGKTRTGLERLLYDLNSATRGPDTDTILDWSMERLHILSIPAMSVKDGQNLVNPRVYKKGFLDFPEGLIKYLNEGSVKSYMKNDEKPEMIK